MNFVGNYRARGTGYFPGMANVLMQRLESIMASSKSEPTTCFIHPADINEVTQYTLGFLYDQAKHIDVVHKEKSNCRAKLLGIRYDTRP